MFAIRALVVVAASMVAAIGGLAQSDTSPDEVKLKVRAWTDKKVYVQGEYVLLKMEIENVSGRPIHVPGNLAVRGMCSKQPGFEFDLTSDEYDCMLDPVPCTVEADVTKPPLSLIAPLKEEPPTTEKAETILLPAGGILGIRRQGWTDCMRGRTKVSLRYVSWTKYPDGIEGPVALGTIAAEDIYIKIVPKTIKGKHK